MQPAVNVSKVASRAEYECTPVADGYIYVRVTEIANISEMPVVPARTSDMFLEYIGGISGCAAMRES